jgi:hypothetical protein
LAQSLLPWTLKLNELDVVFFFIAIKFYQTQNFLLLLTVDNAINQMFLVCLNEIIQVTIFVGSDCDGQNMECPTISTKSHANI